MENWQVVLTIAGAVIVIFGMLAVALPLLQRKGVDVEGGLGKAQTAVEAADGVTDALVGLMPGSPAVLMIDKIVDWAGEAVKAMQQLYRIGQVEDDDRKAGATELVQDMLHAAGIERTEEIDQIISACIEAAVYATKHMGEAEPERSVSAA